MEVLRIDRLINLLKEKTKPMFYVYKYPVSYLILSICRNFIYFFSIYLFILIIATT